MQQPSVRSHGFTRLDGYSPLAAGKLPLIVREDDITAQRAVGICNRHSDFCALYIVRSGKGRHAIEGTTYEIVRGDVYVMGAGATHTYTRCDSLVLDGLYFKPSLFDAPTREMLGQTPGFLPLFVDEPLQRQSGGPTSGRWMHLTPSAHEEVLAAVSEIRRERVKLTPPALWLTRALFVRLLIMLSRLHASDDHSLSSPLEATRHESTIASAIRFIDEQFREPIRVDKIAGSVFLSPDRFTEVFSKLMGRTPRDYIRHLRVEEAKRLLTTTDHPIAFVGTSSGFGEQTYFARVFRAATGMTPREYRNSVRVPTVAQRPVDREKILFSP